MKKTFTSWAELVADLQKREILSSNPKTYLAEISLGMDRQSIIIEIMEEIMEF
jgi:hypothetical protein